MATLRKLLQEGGLQLKKAPAFEERHIGVDFWGPLCFTRVVAGLAPQLGDSRKVRMHFLADRQRHGDELDRNELGQDPAGL